MKIKYRNNAGNWESLICSCDNDNWDLAISDKDGDAFECVKCGEMSQDFTEYQADGEYYKIK